ncbi:MAG: hypothetical protein ACTS4V_01805 [Candidatus Hodgkinia cicadicola]
MKIQPCKVAILENNFAKVIKLSLVKLLPIGKILSIVRLSFTERGICNRFDGTINNTREVYKSKWINDGEWITFCSQQKKGK